MTSDIGAPSKRAQDSPSRQLLWELNKLTLSSQQGFNVSLDRESDEREDLHTKALGAAAQRHTHVRRNAEIEKQRLEEARVAQQKREEDEQRRALEEERHATELAERKRQAQQVMLAKEHEVKMARIQRAQEDVERQRRADKLRQEDEVAKEAQKKVERETMQREEVKARADKHIRDQTQSQAEAMPRSKDEPQEPRGLHGDISIVKKRVEWDTEHTRYLQIHQELKNLRKFITTKAKERPELKAEVGNMRRIIKKSVGQLTGDNRRTPLNTIITTLRKAVTLAEPHVDVNLFFARPPDTSPSNGPGLLVYLLNQFAKAIVAQFVDEASANPKAADPIGIVASHIFALDDFRWKGNSLIDILLAKMHVVAPAIFGVYGPENTMQGKTRLGWWREEGQCEGPFVPQQRHFERMTGLGSGFAALSLRNYEKAKVENPFPDRHYWEALARIARTPPSDMTQTHFVLLKGLIENYETKFIGFYGGAAMAALRLLLLDLPSQTPSPSVASKSLAGLADMLQKEAKIGL